MIRRCFFLLVVWAFCPSTAWAQDFVRTNPKFLQAFREVVAKPAESTVRVICDGKDTALGMIIGPDGWILTKANDLKLPITVRLRDGRNFNAQWVGEHEDHDLAMLKIEATGLKPVDFKVSKNTAVGDWLATVGLGQEPAAVGVVSVATRKLANKGPRVTIDPTKSGYLGIGLEKGEGGVVISQVQPKTPAEKVGIKVKDLVTHLGDQPVADPDAFLAIMATKKPGDVVKLKITRGDESLEIEATLGKRPANMTRGDMQDKMGSELSSRRSGYDTILQHDSVVKPIDCGGPIVDLDGNVIGINICRKGRVESWAIPTEVIQPLLFDLMNGKLAPKKAKENIKAPASKIDAAKQAVKQAEAEKSQADRKLADARVALQKLLDAQPRYEVMPPPTRIDAGRPTNELPRK